MRAGCLGWRRVVMPVQIRCAHCGKEIYRGRSEIEKNRNSFCSRECTAAFYRTGQTVACDWCGAAFYKPLSRLRDNNFCSADCRNRWLGKQNIEVRNVPGHSAGHKAPHLTALNQRRNPLGRVAKRPTRGASSATYRKVAEEMLGRELRPGEVVHHINGDRSDNRPENLAVLPEREHRRLHMHLACRKLELQDEGDDAVCQKTKLSHGE